MTASETYLARLSWTGVVAGENSKGSIVYDGVESLRRDRVEAPTGVKSYWRSCSESFHSVTTGDMGGRPELFFELRYMFCLLFGNGEVSSSPIIPFERRSFCSDSPLPLLLCTCCVICRRPMCVFCSNTLSTGACTLVS
jgi:hypothetical protein